jgi:hypothetical protein
MARRRSESETIRLTFGGGVNSRASPTAIDLTECVDGQNFDLDVGRQSFRRRRPFEAVASAPNSKGILGLVQLEKSTGERSFLVQAGDTVYQWDGASGSSGMTVVGTVSAGAKLRGPLEANSVKDDTVYITDLNLKEPVKTWDGTTWGDYAHDLGGDFLAKYCVIEAERAWFGNVISGTATPHLLVASEQETLTSLTTANKVRKSGLSGIDPFYIPIENLKPINGLIKAFGRVVISTEKGEFYEITGKDATDHHPELLRAGRGTHGAEAVVFTGNDVLFGKMGAIDSLSGSERFGDVEVDDISRWIGDKVKDISDWQMAYSTRWSKLYCLEKTIGGRMFVLHTALLAERVRRARSGEPGLPSISPWSVWVTDDTFNFQPTAMMTMLHPVGGQEHVFMGDRSGNLYMMESEKSQDNGDNLECIRRSAPFFLPTGRTYSVEGYVWYKKKFAATLTLTLEIGGEDGPRDEARTITLAAAKQVPVYNNSQHYNNDIWYGTAFSGRLASVKFEVPSAANQLQVKAVVTGATDFDIEEIGLTFAPGD